MILGNSESYILEPFLFNVDVVVITLTHKPRSFYRHSRSAISIFIFIKVRK